MGVKDLLKVLKKHAPASITEIPVADLRGLRLGVDASISVYQLCTIGRAHGIVNADGQFINHIQGILYRTIRLLELGAVPIYVFDGAPPESKAATMQKRKDARAAGTSGSVPRGVYAEVARLLKVMGIPVVQAPSEAEAEAAHLTQIGMADAIITEDMDALAFGAKKMIRGFNASAKTVMVIDHAAVLAGLGLTHTQFVDLCILLGSDYCPTLPGISSGRALPLIRKWGSIEAIIAQMGVRPPADFDYVIARKSFLEHDVAKAGPFAVGPPGDLRGLLETHALAKKKIDNAISRLPQLTD